MKRATERSLAETVKMRTRGGQADDVAGVEAPSSETAAPKKKLRAANQDANVRPTSSARGQQPGSMKGLVNPDMDGAGDGLLAKTVANNQAAVPESGVNFEGQELGGGLDAASGKLAGLSQGNKTGGSKTGGSKSEGSKSEGLKSGGSKPGKKKVLELAAKPIGEIHCHYCGTRESTYWRRGPDGPKTLCNSCGLNWFRQRPMQREQVEKDNLMAKAVAAAALKRPANSLKEGPEKRKREETKTGTKLREQLHGKVPGEGPRERKPQPPRKKQKVETSVGENGAVAQGIKGFKRSEKGSSIRRKLGDAAVKKAALIKRTPSQLSLMGLLETAVAATETAPEQERASEAATSKLSGVLKGARFSPLKQAQTRLGAQKLLAVLNVISKKKGFGRVTSTTSLESVPEEASPDANMGVFSPSRSGEHTDQFQNEALWGSPELDELQASDVAHDVASDVASDRKRTGVRSQRRPNTALLQGASFLPWKVRPRGWGESSSLTFAAAESRLLKAQAAANALPVKGRPPLHKRSDGQVMDGHDGSPLHGRAGPVQKGDQQNGVSDGLVGEDSDDDGFAGYGVLRKLLEKVDVPPTTSPPSKARPPLNRGQKPQGGVRKEPLESPPRARRPALKGYESFEDLVMGTAGGMKRFESFEDLALRAGPVFARVESFEELALRAGAGIGRFESFEDLAMRSEPVFEMPTLSGPQHPPTDDVAADVARGIPVSDTGFQEGLGRTRGGGETSKAKRDWAVDDGPASKRANTGGEKSRPMDEGRQIDGQMGSLHGAPFQQSGGLTNRQGGPILVGLEASVGRNGPIPGHSGAIGSEQLPLAPGKAYGPALGDPTLNASTRGPGNPSTGQVDPLSRIDHTAGSNPGAQPVANGASRPGLLQSGAGPGVNVFKGDHARGELASQVARLGPRGLSAMALHLLVDCAVDTEPPVDVKMLMQDLETLAIGNAMRGGVNGLLEGAALGETAGVNGLLEGGALGEIAGVNGLLQGSALGNRAGVNALLEEGALGETAGVNGLPEGGVFEETAGMNRMLEGGALGEMAGVNGLLEGALLGDRAGMNRRLDGNALRERARVNGSPERNALRLQEKAVIRGGVSEHVNDKRTDEGPGALSVLPDGGISSQVTEQPEDGTERMPGSGTTAAEAVAPVVDSIPTEQLQAQGGTGTNPLVTAVPVAPKQSSLAVADVSEPVLRIPQPISDDPELHCAEELHSVEETPSYHDTTLEPASRADPKSMAAGATKLEAEDLQSPRGVQLEQPSPSDVHPEQSSPRGVQPEQSRPSDLQSPHGPARSIP